MTPEDARKIDAAIKAHTEWIKRLRAAIQHGSSDLKPGIVRVDNHCDFGRWLYGTAGTGRNIFPAAARGAPIFEEIRTLHASFHRQAGDILQLALDGNKFDALRAMDGDFMLASHSLVAKLTTLKTRY